MWTYEIIYPIHQLHQINPWRTIVRSIRSINACKKLTWISMGNFLTTSARAASSISYGLPSKTSSNLFSHRSSAAGVMWDAFGPSTSSSVLLHHTKHAYTQNQNQPKSTKITQPQLPKIAKHKNFMLLNHPTFKQDANKKQHHSFLAKKQLQMVLCKSWPQRCTSFSNMILVLQF